jgi:hypothetical protein
VLFKPSKLGTTLVSNLARLQSLVSINSRWHRLKRVSTLEIKLAVRSLARLLERLEHLLVVQ